MVVYKLKEVAEMLRVSRGTLLKEIEDGKLKAHKVRKSWRVWKEDLDQYLESIRGGE